MPFAGAGGLQPTLRKSIKKHGESVVLRNRFAESPSCGPAGAGLPHSLHREFVSFQATIQSRA